jgi:Succinylglutamate desuccinylase / Aspartoacylase family
VRKGTVFVIPHANNSASRFNDGASNETSPQWIDLTTASGEIRHFHYGSRRTQTEDQEPDPEVYAHYASGVEFSGNEARNLNRNHPGKAEGTLTQQISYALFQLVEQEGIDVVIDMHEASTTSQLEHMIVCHPRALRIGVIAALDLERIDVIMKIEASRVEYHGLSHWEFGDCTDAYAFLVETPNPGQEKSIQNPDVVNDPSAPLSNRVQIQLATATALVASYSLVAAPDEAVQFAFTFPLDELVGANLGDYLR